MMTRFLAWLTARLIFAMGSTLRMTVHDRARIFDTVDHPPIIMAFWHNRAGVMPYFYWRYCRRRKVIAFISRSRDGEFITRVTSYFGIRAVRGSSSRGGAAAALAALRASADESTDLVITPDGPRGPRASIQPGLLRLAQATGRAIVPVSVHLRWKKELRSWDRFQVPVPFSACTIETREGIVVPEGATEEELVALLAKLKESMGD
jgi:lysophospholipid acyltransferase (LPLAT)-like uncharacterized protein